MNATMTVPTDKNPQLQRFALIVFFKSRTTVNFARNQMMKRQPKMPVAKEARSDAWASSLELDCVVHTAPTDIVGLHTLF